MGTSFVQFSEIIFSEYAFFYPAESPCRALGASTLAAYTCLVATCTSSPEETETWRSETSGDFTQVRDEL